MDWTLPDELPPLPAEQRELDAAAEAEYAAAREVLTDRALGVEPVDAFTWAQFERQVRHPEQVRAMAREAGLSDQETFALVRQAKVLYRQDQAAGEAADFWGAGS
jgi:2-hydroxychromene-2-carboxylate isomerase